MRIGAAGISADVPGYRLDDAMMRLIDRAGKMVSAGTLSFPRDAR
jgi:hypothetical protein